MHSQLDAHTLCQLLPVTNSPELSVCIGRFSLWGALYTFPCVQTPAIDLLCPSIDQSAGLTEVSPVQRRAVITLAKIVLLVFLRTACGHCTCALPILPLKPSPRHAFSFDQQIPMHYKGRKQHDYKLLLYLQCDNRHLPFRPYGTCFLSACFMTALLSKISSSLQ